MEKTLDHKFYTFDSGLRLVVVPMPATRTATVLVMAGTGSKYETKEINGISHFLEHMMFKGTTKRPDKLGIAQELDSIGADYNAFTGKEYTGYYAKASAEKLDTILDVVFDIYLNSKLAEEDIAIEKGVIVEEINMYRDTPQRYVDDLFERLLYGDQPAGWDIAGEKETVIKLKRDDFVKYFNSHYIAGNTIVAVAGNVNPEEIKEKTEKFFEGIRRGDKLTKQTTVESQSAPQSLIHYKKTDQTHFYIGARSYNMHAQEKYPLKVLSVVLGGGMSSRLFQEVRDKRGLAYYVRAGNQAYTDTGYFAVNAGVNNDKIFEALDVILNELRKVRDNGITEDELRRAKDNIEGTMALGLEHSDAIAAAYAEPVLFDNRVLTPEQELDKIKRVTMEEVSKVAKDIFTDSRLNLALIGPFDNTESFNKILKF